MNRRFLELVKGDVTTQYRLALSVTRHGGRKLSYTHRPSSPYSQTASAAMGTPRHSAAQSSDNHKRIEFLLSDALWSPLRKTGVVT